MSRRVRGDRAWRRRGSLAVATAVVLATLGILAMVVQSSVLLGEMTSDVAVAQRRVTNLANAQRGALLLTQSLTDLGRDSTVGKVDVQRGLLVRQLAVSATSFPAGAEEERELQEITKELAGFPWTSLTREDGSIDDGVRRSGVAFVAEIELQVKLLFDVHEKFFYSTTIDSIDQKRRSQTAIAGLVCLVVVLGIGAAVRLRRHARSDVASAYAALMVEVEERRALQEVLAHQAAHDPLTNLANRAEMLDLMEAALHRSHRSGALVGLLFVDLDYFKVVNDTLGHRAGDVVLRVAADRMRSLVRAGDTVGRLGGDEFVVLVEPLETPCELVVLADRLIASVSAPIPVEGQQVTVGASIGVAVGESGSRDANQLLHHADVAAYRAKAAGRGRTGIFDDALRQELAERVLLEAAIRAGLGAGEFLLHYQPVVDLLSGAETSYEALVRWQRPGHGLVPPDDFIPLAEQSAIICEIDRWVLGQATRQLAEWVRTDPEEYAAVTVAVNISGRHLASVDVVADVATALRESGIPPDRLVLEITETVLVDQPTANTQLGALRALGISISIDDFGTGYTSIGQLQHLNADILKIDRSFVASAAPTTRELVRLMTSAGHAFGLHVVAEGVERPEQLAFLAHVGCDSAQGYLFARPQPAVETAARRARPVATGTPGGALPGAVRGGRPA